MLGKGLRGSIGGDSTVMRYFECLRFLKMLLQVPSEAM